jgi:DNA helicase-2/ATP-dependent DNA helicase PcrA
MSLNPPQREAVQHIDGPLLILAGAGSGKTRVIVTRIAYLIQSGVKPWNILAVTFTNKAAAAMRQRVDALVPGSGRAAWVSTFHSFCAQFLRIEGKNIGLDSNYVIYDDSDQLSVVKESLKDFLLSEKQCPPNQIVAAIGRAKDEMLDAGSYLIHAQTHGDPFRERIGHLYERYQKKLKAANALDFGDLIMKTVEAFRDNQALREKYQERFQYVMVDEYQDTNHAQYLLTKYLAGTSKNICVVGDDDQSIYSWRGATIRNIMEFERDYPGAHVVKLEQNYRSSGKILDTANRLIKLNVRRKEKKMFTENDPGEDVHVIEMMNEQEESRFVVEEMMRLRKEEAFSLKDMAVFYRTNAQSRVFEDALRRVSLPYSIVGALRFYERAEIKDALAYLRVVVNSRDSLAVKRIVNVPARGLGKNSLGLLEQYASSQGISLWDAFKNVHAVSGISPSARRGIADFIQLIEKFQAYSAQFPASTVVRRALEESGYWDRWANDADSDPEAAERLDNLQELINAAKDFEDKMQAQAVAEASAERPPVDGEDAKPTLARYLQEISLLSDLDEWKDQGGVVTLMTVHLAKGLEFPAVFVTGLEEGLFPIGDAAFDQDELEEERRLAYVAMTRAKKKLYLSCAASRRIFGTPRMNIPSRFIGEAGLLTKNSTQSAWGGRQGGLQGHSPNNVSFENHVSDRESASPGISGVSYVIEEDFNQDPGDGGAPAPVRRTHDWKVGQRIGHPDFGEGRIIDKEGSGDHAKVTVLFNSGARKKLLLKYAPIQPIGG